MNEESESPSHSPTPHQILTSTLTTLTNTSPHTRHISLTSHDISQSHQHRSIILRPSQPPHSPRSFESLTSITSLIRITHLNHLTTKQGDGIIPVRSVISHPAAHAA
eukprot:GHVN01093992.1.p1 GENE.GHVN01093992.1~~GHVN01093992.1.p1  ORF type:complete len:107 (+),score=48.50 GHVN01093992.1:91-411(+)